MPEASRRIKEAGCDVDAVEVEVRKGLPDLDFNRGFEFTSEQKDPLRSTLKAFARASRPTSMSRSSEVLFGPTF